MEYWDRPSCDCKNTDFNKKKTSKREKQNVRNLGERKSIGYSRRRAHGNIQVVGDQVFVDGTAHYSGKDDDTKDVAISVIGCKIKNLEVKK